MQRFISSLMSRSAAARLLVRIAVRVLVPRHRVGVAGVVVDPGGRILLLEHVVRRRFKWGLPGGWVDRGEDPAAALARELREETGLEVAVDRVLLCERSWQKGAVAPPSIAIAFRCTLGPGVDPAAARVASREIVSARWFDPRGVDVDLSSFHRRAIDEALRY